ncbi:SDR family oxidoreductase [Phenylobacterium sp.]|jgi:NAD(P)-dependent dehydrogenase (short-subunit alcohol dehydrogenase family)|uniref:SDR family oxidoreductase n=1 Tax=Phenylobacterium sp. TaxID=1871053 RepID=UPI0037844497
MDVRGKVVVITGAASGIGKALAERFHREGAEGLVLGDLNEAGVAEVAASISGLSMKVDVTQEADIQRLAAAAEARFGRIDLFCSNAGIVVRDADLHNVASTPDAGFTLSWGVHVMSHIYAARAALPGMIARGSGYFLNTVSAAGLLSQIGSAAYSTTKHAAIGFGESLAITHRNDGIGVSLLCPQAVDTPMLNGARGSASVDGVLSTDAVMDAVMAGLAEERFLILPHEQVLTYMQRKAGDYDRWIRGMVKLRDHTLAAGGDLVG